MKIFWDIDETLIHSRTYIHKKLQHDIVVDVYDQLFYTCVRPCSKSVVEYSRELFGAENVYILTAAAELYAQRINMLAGWNFAEDHIIGRETTERYSIKIPSLYGSDTLITEHPLAHPDNVLIDNLMPEWNNEKTTLMRINPKTNYLKVEDYMGYNEDDEIFRDTVKHFLKTQYEKIKNR